MTTPSKSIEERAGEAANEMSGFVQTMSDEYAGYVGYDEEAAYQVILRLLQEHESAEVAPETQPAEKMTVRDDWKKGEKVVILGGSDIWSIWEDQDDDDVSIVNKAGVVIDCDYARLRPAPPQEKTQAEPGEWRTRDTHLSDSDGRPFFEVWDTKHIDVRLGVIPGKDNAESLVGYHNSTIAQLRADLERVEKEREELRKALGRTREVITRMGEHYYMSDISTGIEIEAIDAALSQTPPQEDGK